MNHVGGTTICSKPALRPGRTGSVMIEVSLFSKTFPRILPAIASRVIPLSLLQSHFDLFRFHMVTTLTSLNCWGTSSFSQMCASRLCTCSARASLDFHISAGMSSGPGALLDFMAWIVARTSSNVKAFARCS